MPLASWRMLLMLALACLLGACGASSAARQPAGDSRRGQQIFDGTLPMAAAGAPPCATCHAVVAGQSSGAGPSLAAIGSQAATRVPAQSAEEYLRSSITSPDAFLADGYQDGIMYRGYGQALSPQQLDDLVAYLLTLKE